MTDDELGQTIAALRGHAKWLRNYAENPKEYYNPIPMTPDELDKIAERLMELRRSRHVPRGG